MSASPDRTPAADAEAPPGAVAARRLAVVGVSEPGPCGVRDHGRLLAEELTRTGMPCSRHWLERGQPGLRGALAEARAWAADLPDAVRAERAESIVLHYSCFATAHRGVPLLARPLVGALRRTALPVVAVMHELTFPFGRAGLRGALWASTQRLALLETLRAVDAVVVTTEERRRWLRSRRWLPRRPVAFAPVFSNLPQPRVSADPSSHAASPAVLAMFGYPHDSSAEVILRALSRLSDPGAPVLRLVGAPGSDSQVGAAWRASAARLGLGERLSFTGVLDPQALSDALAGADLILFSDPPGPTSRKGTLAGSLASGTAVLALDGPSTWTELREAGALSIVAREESSLAHEIARMLGDEHARAELGARGKRFAEAAMGVHRTAVAVGELLDGLPAGAYAGPAAHRLRRSGL